MKPKLLDLFCGGGGAGMGYHRAGFDVTGVDIEPQPHYPFAFVQDDALSYLVANWWRFDAIHASPPCQAYAWSARRWQNSGDREYPDLLVATRYWLNAIDHPYIIENVEQAPMPNAITLCGTQFGLRVFRHRKFESNIMLFAPGGKCTHGRARIGFDANDYVTIAGHGGDGSGRLDNWQDAIGIQWMDKSTITQAIPPAYTEFLGRQLLRYVEAKAA